MPPVRPQVVVGREMLALKYLHERATTQITSMSSGESLIEEYHKRNDTSWERDR